MKIVADENMPLVSELFSGLGDIVFKAGRLLSPEDVKQADILLVRSVTSVGRALLEGSAVKFVGSATIGADHLDQEYLQQQGIAYATAPGCNAQAVVDYVMAALLVLEQTRSLKLENKTLGIVGLGNVGSRLKRTAERFGLNVLVCDPYLQPDDGRPYCDFEHILEADIISFHVPLTYEGDYPTYHMADASFLSRLKPHAVLINASRGAVIDNRALSQVLSEREDLLAVLDVWEGEPLIDIELSQRVEIATPHIAGYSFDGKAMGTYQIYQACCEFLGRPVDLNLEGVISGDVEQLIDLTAGSGVESVTALVSLVYNILEDDLALRSTLKLPRERRVAAFDQLRKHYRLRREFSTVALRNQCRWLESLSASERQRFEALGFAYR